MSKAFTKEEVDPPERSGRVRSPSGLPPGAANYVTVHGARRLREEWERLRQSGTDPERISELEQILGSLTVIEPPTSAEEEIGFGARVTVQGAAEERTYRIVGVDEVSFYPDAVSWITSLGRTLLAAKLGDQINSDETGPVRITKVDYP